MHTTLATAMAGFVSVELVPEAPQLPPPMLNRCRRLAKDWECLSRGALAFLR